MLGKTHFAACLCTSGAIVMVQGLTPTHAAITTAGILLGSLLSDIDSPKSIISQMVKPVGVVVSALAGHRKLFHDPVFYALIFAALWLPNRAIAPWFIPIFIGISTHLFLDAQTPMGIPIARIWRLRMLRIPSGSFLDGVLGIAFLASGIYFFAQWAIALQIFI